MTPTIGILNIACDVVIIYLLLRKYQSKKESDFNRLWEKNND